MPLATGGRITVTSTVCVEEFSLLPTMCISVSKFTGKSCEIHYRKACIFAMSWQWQPCSL